MFDEDFTHHSCPCRCCARDHRRPRQKSHGRRRRDAEAKEYCRNAAASADHKTLVAAVKAAGLVDTLASPGPFTVFAPADAAFAKTARRYSRHAASPGKQGKAYRDPDLSRRTRTPDCGRHCGKGGGQRRQGRSDDCRGRSPYRLARTEAGMSATPRAARQRSVPPTFCSRMASFTSSTRS